MYVGTRTVPYLTIQVKYIFVQIWFSFSHFSAKKHLFLFRKKNSETVFFNSVTFSVKIIIIRINIEKPDIFLKAFYDNYYYYFQSHSVFLRKWIPVCITYWWVINKEFRTFYFKIKSIRTVRTIRTKILF